MTLPVEKSELAIKESIHVILGILVRQYGFIICAGVCWTVKRKRKSIVNINGIIVVMNSSEVMRLLSLIISENMMAMPIKYNIVKAPAIHIITFAMVF